MRLSARDSLYETLLMRLSARDSLYETLLMRLSARDSLYETLPTKQCGCLLFWRYQVRYPIEAHWFVTRIWTVQVALKTICGKCSRLGLPVSLLDLRPSFCWKWTYQSVLRAATTTLSDAIDRIWLSSTTTRICPVGYISIITDNSDNWPAVKW